MSNLSVIIVCCFIKFSISSNSSLISIIISSSLNINVSCSLLLKLSFNILNSLSNISLSIDSNFKILPYSFASSNSCIISLRLFKLLSFILFLILSDKLLLSSIIKVFNLKSSSLFNTENNLENFSLAFIISANEANCPALSSISNPYRLFFNIDKTLSFVLQPRFSYISNNKSKA